MRTHLLVVVALVASPAIGCGSHEGGEGEEHESTTQSAGAGAQGPGTAAGGGDAATSGTPGEGGAGAGTPGGGGAGGGGPPSEAKRVLIHPGETKDAELVKALPVGKSAKDAERRVVMRLSPSEIPKLLAGDRLITPAEAEVTTRCDVGQVAPGCNYNPSIGARLILSGDPGDTGSGKSQPLSDAKTLSCTKADHHCMFVFTPGDATNELEGALELPCVAKNACHVNLVMWAWHPDARSGGQDKVLVGENEGNYLLNGEISGDKGRLMVVRERGIEAADRSERETSGKGSLGVPTNTNPVLVYSHALKAGDGHLEVDEQFLVEAKIVATVSDRARFSTLMFLTKDPKATEPGGLDGVFPAQLGEHNGINCTSGTSPCTTRKVGVFRVTKGVKGPVYVNIIVKSAVPGGGSAAVSVKRDEGWLRSTGYRPEHKG